MSEEKFRTLDSPAWNKSLTEARERRPGSVERIRAGLSTTSELLALERHIAYSAARSDIECMCDGERDGGPDAGWWYDTEKLDCESSAPWVRDAVRYLELRGLLRRHSENNALVRPLNEPVAKGGEA